MIRVGLIGAGIMGVTHAACYEALLSEGYFKLTAVADKDKDKAEKIAQKFGAEVFSDGMELIESGDVNTVDICLPTYMHAEYALKAMKKGCHVFIEKPVCLCEDEAKSLLDMKAQTGVKVAVCQCIRFWDEYVYLKQLADEGTYGSIISGVFKRISPRPKWGWDSWFLDGKRSGSAVLDLHIHDVDYVRYILGAPDYIKSEATAVNGNIEHIFRVYRYGGKVISIEGGWDYPAGFPFEMEYRVRFEKAAVTYNSGKSPTLTVYTEVGATLHPVVKKEYDFESKDLGGNISNLGGYYNELRYFLECLHYGKDIEIAPLEEGVESFRLAMKEIGTAGKQNL